MVPDLIVRTITIDEQGVSLEYVVPSEDIKTNGVQHNHVLFVPRDDDYDDEIGELVSKAIFLVRDVLEDLPTLASVRSSKNKDEEEE